MQIFDHDATITFSLFMVNTIAIANIVICIIAIAIATWVYIETRPLFRKNRKKKSL